MALALSWTGHADTDLQFSEFFDASHTLSLRFMLQCPRGYEGPFIAENGTGTFFLGQGTFTKAAPSPHLLLAVASASLTTKVNLQPGIWYHLATAAKVTATQRVFNLYLNGIPIIEQLVVAAGARGMPKGTLRLGKRTSGRTTNDRNAQCYWLLADVAVFGKQLSESAIVALSAYTTHLGGTESGLLAGLTFSERSMASDFSLPSHLYGLPISAVCAACASGSREPRHVAGPSYASTPLIAFTNSSVPS